MSEEFEKWFNLTVRPEQYDNSEYALIKVRMSIAFAAGQAAEREECAKVAEKYIAENLDNNWSMTRTKLAHDISTNIRKRGDK